MLRLQCIIFRISVTTWKWTRAAYHKGWQYQQMWCNHLFVCLARPNPNWLILCLVSKTASDMIWNKLGSCVCPCGLILLLLTGLIGQYFSANNAQLFLKDLAIKLLNTSRISNNGVLSNKHWYVTLSAFAECSCIIHEKLKSSRQGLRFCGY